MSPTRADPPEPAASGGDDIPKRPVSRDFSFSSEFSSEFDVIRPQLNGGEDKPEGLTKISGVGTATANAEVVKGAETRKAESGSFARAVAKTVLYQKIIIAALLVIVFGTSIFVGLSPWFSALMIAGALWYDIDAHVIHYRVRRGLYGGTEAEAFEAARFVIHTKNRGGGGGNFDRTFEPIACTADAAEGAWNEATGGARL